MRFLPSIERQTLLRAALLTSDDAAAAWRSWRARNEIGAADPASRRLFPLVERNLRGLDLGGDRERLRQVYLQTWIENRRRFHAVRPVLEALAAAGVDIVILKGAALLRFYDGDAGLRPMSDVDVLVRTPDTERAVTVLDSLGYRPAGCAPESLERYARQHLPGWSMVADGRPEIDLHWHVLHQSRAATADDAFWEAAEPLELEGLRLKRLSATDQLLHACAHGLERDERGNLRWVTDAMAIVRGAAAALDWQRLRAQAAAHRLVPQLRQCLRYLATAFDAPIPESLLRALDREPVTLLERWEFWATAVAPAKRSRLSHAVLAYQAQRRGGAGTDESFVRFLPRHLWGTNGWWQMPVWWALDGLGIAPRPTSALAQRIFGPAHVEPTTPPRYTLGEILDFAANGGRFPFLGPGWAPAEPGGIWTESALASIALAPTEIPEHDVVLRIEIARVLLGARRPLVVDVLCNGARVARWRFAAAADAAQTREACLPRALLARPRWQIDLRVLGATSPAALGISQDERLLGLHVRSICLTADDRER